MPCYCRAFQRCASYLASMLIRTVIYLLLAIYFNNGAPIVLLPFIPAKQDIAVVYRVNP